MRENGNGGAAVSPSLSSSLSSSSSSPGVSPPGPARPTTTRSVGYWTSPNPPPSLPAPSTKHATLSPVSIGRLKARSLLRRINASAFSLLSGRNTSIAEVKMFGEGMEVVNEMEKWAKAKWHRKIVVENKYNSFPFYFLAFPGVVCSSPASFPMSQPAYQEAWPLLIVY